MANEAQELVKVQERIDVLTSELEELNKEKSKLNKQLIKSKLDKKKPQNQTIEDVIKERIAVLETLGCKCTLEYNKVTRSYNVVAEHNGRSTKFTYRKHSKDEFVTENLNKYANGILLYNYIETLGIADELKPDLFYVNKYPDANIYVYMSWNDSDRFVRMRPTDESLVSVEIIETVLHMPKYQLDLGDGIVFIQEEVDDECGNLIKEYPFTLKIKDTVKMMELSDFLSSKLKAFETVRNKKFKKLV